MMNLKDKFNPLNGVINVVAIILLFLLIIVLRESAFMIPVATLGAGAFCYFIQRGDEQRDWKAIAGWAVVGLSASLLFYFFAV